MSNKLTVFSKFPRTFWIANTVELFERWSWYGLFMVLALYLTGSKDTGALGFSQEQKGLMMGIVTGTLYFLPIITGAIADKYGYKRMLLISFIIYSSGFILMGTLEGYYSVFAAFFYLAIGSALFKPVISATIAKTTTKETSSIGFGLFYMIVNIGAFIGPVVASKLKENSWFSVFLVSAIIIGINFILVLFFYKEPEREKNKDKLGVTITKIIRNIGTVLIDWKFLIFLFIIIGFWSMYFQLFYSLTVYIDQWMDTSQIYKSIQNISPYLAEKIGTKDGTIAAEMLTNLDAMYIIIFQIIVSTIVMKFKPLNTMMTGIIISSIGIALMFMFNNPAFLFISILIFGIGEMTTSPKITEYIGRIAPKDKKALYMGMSYLPIAGGNFLAGILSGSVFGAVADKINLIKEEVSKRSISIPEITENFSQNDYIREVCNQLNMNEQQLTDYLWNTYNPSQIWYIFSAIGIGTGVLLFLYDRLILKSVKENDTE